MMTVEELRKLEESKLVQELEDAKKQLFKVKFEVKSMQSKNSHKIKELKALVAQIKTVLKEKTLTTKKDD